jgi:ribose-phosphate pyrophosphokinase
MAEVRQDPASPSTTEERVSRLQTGTLPPIREVAVFSGSAHPALAEAMCAHLGVPLLPSATQRFSNDCLEVQLEANCRERDVYIIQPLVPPVQEHLMELLLMLDAARGASASRLTAVIPYYSYARSDKKDKPRISIGARMVADVLVTAGASRILTMALHSPQVHGFFSVPVDNLTAVTVLSDHFAGCDRSRTIVVSPDLGNAKSATVFARLLDLPVAAGSKRRVADDRVVIDAIVGDVDGRDVIVLDDEIANAGTIVELSRLLRLRGVRRIAVACTHGLFTGPAIERLAGIQEIEEIVTTDTVPIPPDKQLPSMRILSIAPLMSEAIRRIHGGESVSALFAAG